MKLVHYREGRERKYGFLVGKRIMGSELASKIFGIDLPKDISDFILSWSRLNNDLALVKGLEDHLQEGIPLERVKKILAPITHPPKIICLGLNYKTHAMEWKVPPPSEPIVFMKPRTAIIGPYDDIVSPSITKKLDYEVELAVVIGKECKRISEDKASDYILGYMVLNDITARDLQRREKQWFMGKGLDTFAPIGPWIVTKDELNVDNLRLTTRVNGERRQDGSTRDMIFKVDYLISWLSKGITLEPGDVISTGTPSGVGVYMNPPSFLKEGDIVEVSIEGIGSLRNRVRFEKI
ncbi:MAG: fumarylacetoacetate hydrolase family protein [archaeon]|nr:fumarylacetoacetate hydrolase family protein [archaeon]MCP8305515.1 fumarylacetoacetate hydrolase family protein [archaeon]